MINNQDIINEKWIPKSKKILKVFNLLVENNHLNSKNEQLTFLLGALVNETVYLQQSEFRTNGVLKRVSTFYNNITLTKIREIFNLCKRIITSISKKKKFYGFKSDILSNVEDRINETSPDAWKKRNEKLAFIFTTGYNFYNAIYNLDINTELKLENLSIEQIFPNDHFYRSKFPELTYILNIDIFKDDISFQIGIYSGIFLLYSYFLQKKHFKNKSILKFIISFTRNVSSMTLIALLSKVFPILFKICAQTSKNSSSLNKIRTKTYIYGTDLELILYKLLMEEKLLNENSFFLGFLLSLGFINDNAQKKKTNTKKNQKKVINDNEELSDMTFYGDIMAMIENDELEQKNIEDSKNFTKKKANFIKNHFPTNKNQIPSFLTGILINRMSYEEEKILKTSRLKKRFSFLIRHLDFNNLNNLMKEIAYTSLSCWLYNQMHDKSFYIDSWIISEYCTSLDEIKLYSIHESSSVISLIQGYNTIRTFFKQNKIQNGELKNE